MNDTIKIGNYIITKCTAIADCDEGDEAARQDALLVVSVGENCETAEHVVFGWELPADKSDLIDMLDDTAAWIAVSDKMSVLVNGGSIEEYKDSIFGLLTQATY